MRLTDFDFLTDENIDAAVVEFLRERGLRVRDVKEDRLFEEEDITLLRLALSERRIVLTHDADFGMLAVAAGEPYLGILYLRPGHIRSEFTVGTLRTVFTQDISLAPPFIIVAARLGDRVKVRVRQRPEAVEAV